MGGLGGSEGFFLVFFWHFSGSKGLGGVVSFAIFTLYGAEI